LTARRVVLALLVLIFLGGILTALYHLAGGIQGSPAALGLPFLAALA
jgi:hypothetical protein